MDQDLLDMGFEQKGSKESLIGESFILIHKSKHGKLRTIGITNQGNPNEIVTVGELKKDRKTYEDLVIVSNYDYDGYVSLERIKALVFALTNKQY